MPRRGVNYVQNEDPSFIKQFKERIGHKEGPTVDTKRDTSNFEDDEDEDVPEKEDEKPTIVVLNEGDLTAEEVKKEQKVVDEGPARLDEKITFKKPSKRTQEAPETSTDSSSTVKKSKESKKKKESTATKTKNNSLLSFEEGDEDD